MSSHSVIASSLVLFIDQLLTAGGNWFFWILISKIASTSEIGQATAIYSLVLFTSTVAQLGLEYPILKRSQIDKSKIFVALLLLEMVFNAISIPVILYVIESLALESVLSFSIIASLLLINTTITFVSRFYLLGLSNARLVLVTDVLGTVVKFVVAYVLVDIGYGAIGLLISFVLQSVIMNAAIAFLIRKHFSFILPDIGYYKKIFMEGLINAPSKLSRSLVLSLSVVLLASLGVSASQIGVFYIVLTLSIVAASLASSIAYMVIPFSSTSDTDVYPYAVRVALSLTAPIVTVLITGPQFLLATLGNQYVSGAETLVILAISILPSCIVMISISKLNNLSRFKNLIAIGLLQVTSFTLLFYLLVPLYASQGAAISIMISFMVTSVPCVIWFGRSVTRIILGSIVSILIGVFCGFVCTTLTNSELVAIVSGLVATILATFLLKNLSTKEIKYLVKTAINKN